MVSSYRLTDVQSDHTPRLFKYTSNLPLYKRLLIVSPTGYFSSFSSYLCIVHVHCLLNNIFHLILRVAGQLRTPYFKRGHATNSMIVRSAEKEKSRGKLITDRFKF
jgi:hypothetical protein